MTKLYSSNSKSSLGDVKDARVRNRAEHHQYTDSLFYGRKFDASQQINMIYWQEEYQKVNGWYCSRQGSEKFSWQPQMILLYHPFWYFTAEQLSLSQLHRHSLESRAYACRQLHSSVRDPNNYGKQNPESKVNRTTQTIWFSNMRAWSDRKVQQTSPEANAEEGWNLPCTSITKAERTQQSTRGRRTNWSWLRVAYRIDLTSFY